MAQHLEEFQTPFLVIDLDRARANIARTLEILESRPDRWRPHVKTAKVPAVMRLYLEAGIHQFKCATTKEAAVLLNLADQTPIDLLVSMALQGANLERAAALARKFPQHRVSVLSEDAEHAAALRDRCPELGIFVDLDPGYGRTGIPLESAGPSAERALEVARACGASLRGLHSYEGQFGAIPPPERPALADRIHRQLTDLADRVTPNLSNEDMGSPLELITSGTPAFTHALHHPSFAGRLHRVSPGTVVYSDLTTDALNLGYRSAAKVYARVISRPSAHRATLDAGSKAVDAAAGDPCARVEGWEHLEARKPSEEHLPLAPVAGSTDSSLPALGDLLALIPRHVCPTVNLADEAVLVEGGEIVDVVRVDARGHAVRG